jgi:gamma-resorcylate decarboxylase
MKNKIVLEEHVATTDTIGDSQEYFPAEIWPERRRQLLDFQAERLERMDACGIGFAILSLNAPAIQGIPHSAKAIDVPRQRHPGRTSSSPTHQIRGVRRVADAGSRRRGLPNCTER